MILTPKNWTSFQHYKDRAPAWIKLHKGLLNDYAFSRLPVASRALAPLLWLLASEYEDGKIEGSLEELAFRLRMNEGELGEALNPLIEGAFFSVDSNTLADRKQVAIPEEKEEKQDKTEEEKSLSGARAPRRSPDDFEKFWKDYPKTPVMSKKQAVAEWLKLSPEDQSSAAASLSDFKSWLAKQKDHPVVHACRFLSQRRFEGFATAEVQTISGFYAPADSEQITAWDASKPGGYPRDRNGGWWFSSEWPLGYTPKSEAA